MADAMPQSRTTRSKEISEQVLKTGIHQSPIPRHHRRHCLGTIKDTTSLVRKAGRKVTGEGFKLM